MLNTPPFIQEQDFSNLEEYCFAAKRWNLDFKKISNGDFWASIKMIDYGNIQIAETKIKGVILQNGSSPKNAKTIVIPGDEMQSFMWLNYKISSDYMVAWPSDNSISAITNSSFHVYTISIQNEFLKELQQIHSLKTLDKKLAANRLIYSINRNYLHLLNSYLSTLFKEYFTEERLIKKQSIFHASRLPHILLDYMDKQDPTDLPGIIRKQDEAVKIFLDHYNVPNIPKQSIAEFCETQNISQRTLEKGIRDFFHTSPIGLISALKLNRFRKVLVNNPISISDAANKCGFTHMGQLSKDYKKLFNEVPSETIKRERI